MREARAEHDHRFFDANGDVRPFRSLEHKAELFMPKSTEAVSVPVSGLPTLINDLVSFRLKRSLTGTWRKSRANIHRLCVQAKLEWMEKLAEDHPRFRDDMAKVLESGDERARAEMRRGSLRYEVKDMLLGEKSDKTQRIYCNDKDEATRIHNVADDLGLSVSVVTVLILVAALAWSEDEQCVPTVHRDRFAGIIADFDRRLEPWRQTEASSS